MNTDTGELSEARLGHKEQAEQFYRDLRTRGLTVRVGMEASGLARWFERLLSELQFELWIGDAAAVHTKRVRKQKTDRQDAQLLLRLLLEDRFPRIVFTARPQTCPPADSPAILTTGCGADTPVGERSEASSRFPTPKRATQPAPQ